MSGKFKLCIRQGKSLDYRYDYYPEAFLEVKDENGKKKVILSPPYRSRNKGDSIEELLMAFRIHELKVDRTRDRRRYTSALISFLEDMIEKLSQTKMEEFEPIEAIYLNQRKVK